MNKFIYRYVVVCFVLCMPSGLKATDIFIEAESFNSYGGWKLDTQFIQSMGSPYLLAHGLGRPVQDAEGTVKVHEAGKYRVWVRTYDWVARWAAKPSPGTFQISIGEQKLPITFGTESPKWDWQDGGIVELEANDATIRLHDLTGFDGRIDCIFLTTELEKRPPQIGDVLGSWRRQQLGLPDKPVVKSGYDLVVVGGGYAGVASALSAARMGCRVALIQDRGVLGGNGSSEVRVWAKGNIRRGEYSRIGEIVEEFSDHATKSPGTYKEFGDEWKETVVRAEKNIDLMLNHHAYQVEMAAEQDAGPRRIQTISVFNTKTGEDLRVSGKCFADCTGHGWIGFWAKADHEMEPKGRMGMSNMWRWDEDDEPRQFPQTPWALDLNMADFPYPRDHHGQWFWESGFDKDPLGDAEGIRDWNLRAVYGAFNAMKNKDGAEKHASAFLSWVAYVGGPRESRRLLGDVILTQEDIVTKRKFDDGFVPSTWSIDLHYPKKQYAQKFPDNPFISIAVHDRRVDRMYGYPVPYRCFYSRNVANLFMAGRCISVSHQALGTVRVMKTCGMMGEVVGKAASICTARSCDPADVYHRYLPELKKLLRLPGKARRLTPTSELQIPDDALEEAPAYGVPTGLNPTALEGVVADDIDAQKTGKWTSGNGLKPYVGIGYVYASPSPENSIAFSLELPRAGKYQLRIYSLPHANRSSNTRVIVSEKGGSQESFTIDQKQSRDEAWISGGIHQFSTTSPKVKVTILTENSNGLVHADAVSLIDVSK